MGGGGGCDTPPNLKNSRFHRAPRRTLLPHRNATSEVRKGLFTNFEVEILYLL